jgi:hypothetical protein
MFATVAWGRELVEVGSCDDLAGEDGAQSQKPQLTPG